MEHHENNKYNSGLREFTWTFSLSKTSQLWCKKLIHFWTDGVPELYMLYWVCHWCPFALLNLVIMWCWVWTIVKLPGERSRTVLEAAGNWFFQFNKDASFTPLSNHLCSLPKIWRLLSSEKESQFLRTGFICLSSEDDHAQGWAREASSKELNWKRNGTHPSHDDPPCNNGILQQTSTEYIEHWDSTS